MSEVDKKKNEDWKEVEEDLKKEEIKKEDFFIYGDEDEKKGKWREMTIEELKNQMEGLLDYFEDSEYANLDWDDFNFKVYDKDYYQEKYKGFDEKVYEILAESTKEENKVLDKRQPTLEIKHKEVTLKFD
jgi:hypothetical protein